LEGLGINLGYVIVQILNFAILFIVIKAWAIKPIMNMLETRREKIAKGLEDARVAEEARTNAEQAAEKITSEAQAKSAEIVREATERAEAIAREIKADSEAEIVKSREAAMSELESERDRMLAELRGQVASLAIAAAQKLVGDALMRDEAHQHTLLDEFFSGVKSGKVVVLEKRQMKGTSAEVTSALPLNNEEQDIVKKDILSTMGADATVTFRVDPKILGGLIIRVGDQVIDGSVVGQLQELKQNF
jgi:F-type H+-transporting ATPase subunit b